MSESKPTVKELSERVKKLEEKISTQNVPIGLKETAILEEYKTLREEILDQIRFAHQINHYALAFGGAVGAGILLGKDINSFTRGVLLLIVGIIFVE